MTTGLAAAMAAAESISKSDHDAAVAAARAEGLAAGIAEGKVSGAKDGAANERTRIAGIEANALPGHEQLVAAMKADPSVTPDMAAGRILAAERELRKGHMQAITDVETVTGRVAAAPTSQPTPPSQGSEKATTPEGWKAEYAASPALQGEFATVEDYVALKTAEAAGKVKVFAPGVARVR